MKTTTSEIVESLCHKFIMIGVHIVWVANVFCDNEAVYKIP